MKQTFFVLKTLLLAGLASLVAIGDSIAQDNHLYIAMGTSVAAGFQPRPLCALDPENSAITPPCDLLFDRPTDQSPADRLSQILAAEDGEQLELIKLGCGGETTTQMITGAGSLCYDETASQLDRALALLDEHGERVRLITIDIGVNDVIGCFDGSGGSGARMVSARCIATVWRYRRRIGARDRAGCGRAHRQTAGQHGRFVTPGLMRGGNRSNVLELDQTRRGKAIARVLPIEAQPHLSDAQRAARERLRKRMSLGYALGGTRVDREVLHPGAHLLR